MEEHIYTSANGDFIPWYIWVQTHGMPDDIRIHDDPNATPAEKEDLYERWLEDQKIDTYTRKVDGVVKQYQEWDWA